MRGYSKATEAALRGDCQDKEQSQGLQKQKRKKRAANGAAASKMMSFRIDAENVKILDGVDNKGRFVNSAIANFAAFLQHS